MKRARVARLSRSAWILEARVRSEETVYYHRYVVDINDSVECMLMAIKADLDEEYFFGYVLEDLVVAEGEFAGNSLLEKKVR